MVKKKFIISKINFKGMSNFEKIVQDIKELKISGATNIALKGLDAMKIRSDYPSLKKLLSSRPTEPCLQNAIKFAKQSNPNLAYNYLKNMDKRVELLASRLIKDNMVIFTHCHSTTVIGALKKARERVNFEVHNTETRPLYQGRKTAKKLADLKIKVTHFVDSGAEEALERANIVLLGADLITPKGIVYNKIGSYAISELAKKHKTPLYIVTNSWKYSKDDIKIEERPPEEIWNIKNNFIKIRNPAFEDIPPQNIKAIVCELGVFSPKKFIKKVEKTYNWIK